MFRGEPINEIFLGGDQSSPSSSKAPLYRTTFVLMQYDPYPYTSTLGKFELFGTHLTDPRTQNVKALHFDAGPGPDFTHDRNL